jgi:hypothetical protein
MLEKNKHMTTRDFWNSKRVVSAALSFIVSISLVFTHAANAATLIFQKQGNDNFEPLADLRYDHETRNMAIEIYDDNKDLVTVRLTFASNVSNTTFASSSTLLRVKFMPYLSGTFKGNTGNIWIEAPRTAYQGSKKIPAVASSYVSDKSLPTDPRKDMSACGALTWMDDVASRNMVSFQFSRNCFDLPNTFWAISQVETDLYNSTLSKDVRYTPIEPFYVDMQSVPKPPKIIPKKDQTISATTSKRDYFIDDKSIQVIASSSGGAALTYSSKTPDICAITSTGLIQPKNAGSCQVAVDAAGSETLNAAPSVFLTINIAKKPQNIYFNSPGAVYITQGFVNLDISSEFNLLVQVVSTTPNICTFPYQASSPTTVQLLLPGYCSFKMTQVGNSMYSPRESFGAFTIYTEPVQVATPTPTPTPKPTPKPRITTKPTVPKPTPTEKKIVITCVSGKMLQKISGTNPKCPTGFTKKS